MKKLSFLALASLVLVSCNGGGASLPTFSGFDVKGAVTGSNIDVNVLFERDTSGDASVKETKYVLTQPEVYFVARAGSVGGVVTNATVQLLDASGNSYGGSLGTYPMNFAARITPGWVCVTSDGVLNYAPDPNVYVGKPNDCVRIIQQTRTTYESISEEQLITGQVAEFIAVNCSSDFGCDENLRASIKFDIVDDNGKEKSVYVDNIPLNINAQYILGGQE